MAFKQMDYSACKQLMLQLLPPDKITHYTRLFNELEEAPEKALYAGLQSVAGQMLDDPKSVRADSLMKGMFLGINLALASNSDGTRQMIAFHDEMQKKIKGTNVVGFHEAQAKK